MLKQRAEVFYTPIVISTLKTIVPKKTTPTTIKTVLKVLSTRSLPRILKYFDFHLPTYKVFPFMTVISSLSPCLSFLLTTRSTSFTSVNIHLLTSLYSLLLFLLTWSLFLSLWYYHLYVFY